MPNILAIDTATDICSIALRVDGETRQLSENIPRQHSQRLFSMLRELLPDGNLKEQGVDLLSYNHGPGSFTGLRIAASAIQGLAFSNSLPVAAISSLACMAEGARRRGELAVGQAALVLLDARINEVYWALYQATADRVVPVHADTVARPDQLPESAFESMSEFLAVGNGLNYCDTLPSDVRDKISVQSTELWPNTLDTISLADLSWQSGKLQDAHNVAPVYVRDKIGWKKLAEQGPQ